MMNYKYSKLQIWLQWSVFVLIVCQYLFHDAIAQAYELRIEGKDWVSNPLIPLHLLFGGLVFLLVASRLWIRLEQGVPDYPRVDAKVMKLLSLIVHWSFYGTILLLPITGGMAWFQLSQSAGNAHEKLRGILLILIFLHVAASLFHYFVLKTNLFRRMWWN